MKKYTLRKIGKKLIPVTLGVLAATALSVVENEVNAKEHLNIEEAKSNEEKINKEKVDKAKEILENIVTKETEIKQEIQKAKDSKENTEKSLEEVKKEIAELNKINVTPEQLVNLTKEIENKKEELKIEETNKEHLIKNIADKNQIETSQEKKVKEETDKLETKKSEIKTIINDKTEKAKEQNQTTENIKAKQKEQQKLEEQLSEQIKNKEKIEQELEEAKKQEASLQQEIETAKQEKNKAQEEVNRLERVLQGYKSEIETAKQELQKAEQELTKKQQEIDSYNTITLTKEYIDNLKKAFDYSLSEEEREQATRKLKEINEEVKSKNKYKEDSSDDKQTLYNINNLPKEIRTNLSLFASDLVNQIREQMGLPKTKVVVSSVDFADKVATTYNRDNFNMFEETEHYEKGIIEVAKEYGLPEGQYYEDWAGDSSISAELSYSDLKKHTYKAILQFMFNGKEWKHAQSVAGINYGDPIEEYLGIDFSTYPKYAGVHLLTITKDKVENATNKTFDATEIQPKKSLEIKKQELEEVTANKNKKEKSVNNLTQQKNNAEETKQQADKTLEQKIEKYNQILAKTTLTKEATEKLNQIKKDIELTNSKLTETKQEIARLQVTEQKQKEELKNIENTIKIKQADLQNTKSVLIEEQGKLEIIKQEKEELEKQLATINEKITQKQKELQEKQEQLNKLINIPTLKKQAEEQEIKLEANKKVLQLKIAELEKELILLTKAKEKEEIKYNEILIKYNEQQENKNNQQEKQNKEQQDNKINEKQKEDKTKTLTNTGLSTETTLLAGVMTIIGALALRRKQK